MEQIKILSLFFIFFIFPALGHNDYTPFYHLGEDLYDSNGKVINAHGGGITNYNNTFYWYGEYREKKGPVKKGFSLYSSSDLIHWDNRGVVFDINKNQSLSNGDIQSGAIFERPKVIYDKNTKKFLMFFHFERKGEGYKSALIGLATSILPEGPFEYIRSFRLNANTLPHGINDINQIEKGSRFKHDYHDGQMSRDLNVFIDTDSSVYLVSASENNSTLIITKLTKDLMHLDKFFVRVAPGGYNEAPILFRKNNFYYLITSGTSGWVPNQARLFMAKSIEGHWSYIGSPVISLSEQDVKTTFYSQGAFVTRYKGTDYFVADRWNQADLSASKYIWIPIKWSYDIPKLTIKKHNDDFNNIGEH